MYLEFHRGCLSDKSGPILNCQPPSCQDKNVTVLLILLWYFVLFISNTYFTTNFLHRISLVDKLPRSLCRKHSQAYKLFTGYIRVFQTLFILEHFCLNLFLMEHCDLKINQKKIWSLQLRVYTTFVKRLYKYINYICPINNLFLSENPPHATASVAELLKL